MANRTLADAGEQTDRLIGSHVWVNPNRMGGEACFVGTRVPVQYPFDHLRAGDGFEELSDGYEGVTRDQVVGVIDMAARGLLDGVRAP